MITDKFIITTSPHRKIADSRQLNIWWCPGELVYEGYDYIRDATEVEISIMEQLCDLYNADMSGTPAVFELVSKLNKFINPME